MSWSINEWILVVMAGFAVLGIVDRMIGNRFGLGKEFEAGLLTIGPMTVAVAGMIVLSPVLAEWLTPVLLPVFSVLGADPAMFAGCILANDMGGSSLAISLAQSKEAGNLSGLIVSSMLGATVAFHIPVSLGVVEKEDHEYIIKGILAGIMTIPIGSFAGGLTAGYGVEMLIRNLTPIILFAVVLAIGFWKCPAAIVKGFTWFGRGVVILSTLGLGVGILEVLTGITCIPGTASIYDGVRVAADCAIVLAGAYPMVHILIKACKKPLNKLGSKMGINEISAAGLIATLASNLPVFSMIRGMDNRGKVVTMAFVVSATSAWFCR